MLIWSRLNSTDFIDCHERLIRLCLFSRMLQSMSLELIAKTLSWVNYKGNEITTLKLMVIQTVICHCSFTSSRMLFGYKVQTWILSRPLYLNDSHWTTYFRTTVVCAAVSSTLHHLYDRESHSKCLSTHTQTRTHTAVMLLVAHFSFWQDARQHTLYRLSVGLAAAVIPWMTQVR